MGHRNTRHRSLIQVCLWQLFESYKNSAIGEKCKSQHNNDLFKFSGQKNNKFRARQMMWIENGILCARMYILHTANHINNASILEYIDLFMFICCDEMQEPKIATICSNGPEVEYPHLYFQTTNKCTRTHTHTLSDIHSNVNDKRRQWQQTFVICTNISKYKIYLNCDYVELSSGTFAYVWISPQRSTAKTCIQLKIGFSFFSTGRLEQCVSACGCVCLAACYTLYYTPLLFYWMHTFWWLKFTTVLLYFRRRRRAGWCENIPIERKTATGRRLCFSLALSPPASFGIQSAV